MALGCPHVPGSSLGVMKPGLLNPQGASTQGLPERRVRLDCAGTAPQDHNLDPGSVLHVTSEPGDPVPRSRASAPAAPTLLISQWTMWPSVGHPQYVPRPERGGRPLCPAQVTDLCVQVLSITKQLHAGVRTCGWRTRRRAPRGTCTLATCCTRRPSWRCGRGQAVWTGRGGVRQPAMPRSGPGRRGRASEGMGTRPLRRTYGHSRQERQTSKGTTLVHSS